MMSSREADKLSGKSEWKESEYAVYKYIPNQETIERTEYDSKTVGQGFSLILVGTSIPSDREPFLREHVGTKITHSSLYRSSGQVTSLDPELFPPSSQSYHCLVEVNSGEGTKEEQEVLYLLSFMSIGKQGLDLFRTDLDSYCMSLSSLLAELPEGTPYESFSGSSLEVRIKNWFSDNVEYLSRVVHSCQTQLPVLLHTAVEPHVEVVGEEQGAGRDIKQFLEACSLAHLMQFTEETNSPEEYHLVEVTPTEDGCEVIGGVSNKFCMNWSQVLLAQGASSPDPFFLRQALENYKLKIIQDLNALKRLLRQAETDYHSLYKCYVFMCSCGNGSQLLRCALKEAQTLSSSETQAVLEAIKLYTDKHGFRDTATV